jgi:hypothetical protein
MSNWETLGRAVLSARDRAGYSDTRRWSELVGRSSRMLLGLERGEQVGPKTLARVEGALGWPVGWTHRILAGEADAPPPPEPTGTASAPTDDLLRAEIRELRAAVEMLAQKLNH